MPLFIQTLISLSMYIKEPKCLWQHSFPLFHSNTLPRRAAWNMTVLGRDTGKNNHRIFKYQYDLPLTNLCLHN